MNTEIDETTMEALVEKTGRPVIVETNKIQKGILSEIKGQSIIIISEMGGKKTIAFEKIKKITLGGEFSELLYQN